MQLSKYHNNIQIKFQITAFEIIFSIFIAMENLLVVLIFVASIIYKIYVNFKKEMEKSAQRTPQRPNTHKSTVQPSLEQQKKIPPFLQPINPSTSKETTSDFVTKSKAVQEIPEEVQRIKESRKIKESAVSASYNQEKNAAKSYPFDLREAIIQAAILERPYK